MNTAWTIFDFLCYTLIAVAPALFYLSPRSRRCFAATIRRPSRWMLVAAVMVSADGVYKLVELLDETITLKHNGFPIRLGMAISIVASTVSIIQTRLRQWSVRRNHNQEGAGDVGDIAGAGTGIKAGNSADDFIPTLWGDIGPGQL